MTRDSRFVLILLAVAMVLFFFGLGDMALTDPDETFYAQTAREMINAGEWITPTIFGSPQFEKPVFYYWLVAASYGVFGINEFAARFPSALFGIAGVIGVYFLGRLFFSPLCGFFSGLILATCVQYIVLSRACVTDMVLAVFILFCLLFFLLGWTTGKRAHYLISSVMAALAVMTKGPIGLFIPGAVVILYVIFSRQWKGLRSIPAGWCVLVFLAVCLPWYLAVTRVHGSAFIGEFFGFQNVTRFLKPEHRIGISPFYYIPVIIGGFFPWSLFLPLGAWALYKEREGACRVKAHRAFFVIWFLAVFLFFSVSRTKLVTYIFPLFPVMAVVTGRFWERFAKSGGEDRSLRRYMNISYYIFAVSGFLALAGIYLFVRHEYAQALAGVALTEAVFAVGLLLSLLLFLRGRKGLSFLSIVSAVMLLSVPLVRFVLPVIEEFESSKAVSCRVKELSTAAEAVGGESDTRRGIAFYTGRIDIEDIHSYREMNDFISRKGRVWGIVKRKHYDKLRSARPAEISKPVFQAGEKVVFTNRPFSMEQPGERS
ncbi:MAG: hypothetical protein DRP85_06290 [Candidatus Makaraimicrobium thalassicum]|nr:MAG: hypothetical protein DRP85_06290 [Candidatus Omnitrophota bacterium]